MKKYLLIFSKLFFSYMLAAIALTLYIFWDTIGRPAHAHVPFSGGLWFLVFSPGSPFLAHTLDLGMKKNIIGALIFVSTFFGLYFTFSKLGVLLARKKESKK